MKVFHSLLVSMLISFFVLAVSAQDAKVLEIVTKNLDSIGAKDKRDAIKNQMAVGASEFESKLPSLKGGGKAIVVSDRDNLYFLMSLNSKEYPFEKIGYFNGKISLPFVTAGTRSPLGAFVSEHEKILSQGMFNGTMSGRWILLGWDKKRGKLTYGGSKKIDGRKVHTLQYFPSDGASSEFTLRMYFDAETYRHVRSEYLHEVASKQDTFGSLGRQAGVKLELVENFSDFRTVDGMTLPYSYKANFLTSSNSGVYEYVWGLKITQYAFNRNLAGDFFTFDVK